MYNDPASDQADQTADKSFDLQAFLSSDTAPVPDNLQMMDLEVNHANLYSDSYLDSSPYEEEEENDYESEEPPKTPREADGKYASSVASSPRRLPHSDLHDLQIPPLMSYGQYSFDQMLDFDYKGSKQNQLFGVQNVYPNQVGSTLDTYYLQQHSSVDVVQSTLMQRMHSQDTNATSSGISAALQYSSSISSGQSRSSSPYHANDKDNDEADLFSEFEENDTYSGSTGRRPSMSPSRRTNIPPETMSSYIQIDPDNKFTCLYAGCLKRFNRKYNIQSHIQTHLADRPFKCSVCHAGFVRRHDLRRHARIHGGEKPHKCPCGKGFARMDAMTRHRQRGICVGKLPGLETRRGRIKVEQ